MKTLSITGLMLLMSATASFGQITELEAGPTCVPGFCAEHSPEHLSPFLVPKVSINCVDLMESVMRLIEPWIHDVHRTLVVAPNGDWVWEFLDQPATGIPKNEVHKLVHAKEQWELVKKECWRQP